MVVERLLMRDNGSKIDLMDMEYYIMKLLEYSGNNLIIVILKDSMISGSNTKATSKTTLNWDKAHSFFLMDKLIAGSFKMISQMERVNSKISEESSLQDSG